MMIELSRNCASFITKSITTIYLFLLLLLSMFDPDNSGLRDMILLNLIIVVALLLFSTAFYPCWQHALDSSGYQGVTNNFLESQ